jgi:transcriptional regulator with XRE-family HTH domain
VSRTELADFLRACRGRVQPADVGLPAGTRRRTPGLRREEVARLAGISVDYYVRLEQARGPRPSRQVLMALVRALRLSDDERGHLLRLACVEPVAAGTPDPTVPVGVLYLLDLLGDLPAYVLSPRYDVLAWNPAACALVADFSSWPDGQRNLVWQVFCGGTGGGGGMATTGSADGSGYTAEQWAAFAAHCVADLREAAGRFPDDPGFAALVSRLRAASPEFARRWDANEVAVRQSMGKRLHHPVVGPMELEQLVLHLPECDQRLVVYVPAPGSRSADALRLLAVVGGQRW